MNCVNADSLNQSPHETDNQGSLDMYLYLEPEVIEIAAADLPLQGYQMDATLHGPDVSEKYVPFLSLSPLVSFRQHSSEVHARAAYGANNFAGGDRFSSYSPD